MPWTLLPTLELTRKLRSTCAFVHALDREDVVFFGPQQTYEFLDIKLFEFDSLRIRGIASGGSGIPTENFRRIA